MIKYKLICKDCDNSFDSWFSSSKEYEKLKKLKHVNCNKCNSLNVEKTLMSPSIFNSKKQTSKVAQNEKYKEVKSKIREYQQYIKNNFKYVGENFAYEARSIHYNNKKSENIYGKASLEEIKDLKEEGIDTEVVPWLNEKNN